MACGCGKKRAQAKAGGQTGVQASDQPVANRSRRAVRRTIFAVVPPPECDDCVEELFVVLHSAGERAKALGAGWRVERRKE